MSDFIEILGFAAIVDGVDRLLGVGAAFVAAGIFLIFVGAVMDDASIGRAIRSAGRAPFRLYASWAARDEAPAPRRRSAAGREIPLAERPLDELPS